MVSNYHPMEQALKTTTTHLFIAISTLLVILCTDVSGEIISLPLHRFSGDDLHNGRSKRSVDGSVFNQKDNLEGKPGQGYYLVADIGTPPQRLNVLIDTGSSNFAIAASQNPEITKYFVRDQSSSYKEIGTSVFVPYTQGNWKGVLGTDLVTLTSLPNVTVTSNIAFITHSSNFFINGSNWQGILGLAYSEIARPDSSVVPYFDALVRDGGVTNKFALQLCGTIENSNNNSVIEMGGTMTIGGLDSTLYTGDIYYTNLYKEWYYEVTIVDIQVNGESLKMDCKEYNFPKTIVDSGTTNLRLPNKVFNEVVSRIKKFTSAKGIITPSDGFWSGDDNICWKKNNVPYSDFPIISLSFPIGKNSTFILHLSPQQYIRALGESADDDISVADDEDCFKFGLSGSQAGTVIGAVVMEGYYVIFDRMNKRIGFAESTCPVHDQSVFKSTVKGPFPAEGNISDCAYVKVQKDDKTLTVVAYVMAGICCFCLLPLIIMVIHWQCRKHICTKNRNRKFSDTNDLMHDPN